MHIADACVMMHTIQAHSPASHPLVTEAQDPVLDWYESHSHEITKHPPDYQALQPMFGWLPKDISKWTFEVTTQYLGFS